MSPDWAEKPEDVPYSSLDNPQTLNLYGYVENNPLSKADPDGHADPITLTIGIVEGISALGSLVAEYGPTVASALATAGAIVLSSDNPGGSGARVGPAPALPTPTAPAAGEKTGEPPQLTAGKDAHKNEEVRPGEKAEVPTPSKTGRMDRYNADKAHIREIKPDNARGEKSGRKQLRRYKAEMEKATKRPHTTELTKYPPPTPKS